MSKNNNSGGGSNSGTVRIAAFWALVLAAVAEALSFIFSFFKDNFKWNAVGILSLVASILLILAIGLAAWDFVKHKKRVWRVVFFVALIILVLFRVFSFGQWFY